MLFISGLAFFAAAAAFAGEPVAHEEAELAIGRTVINRRVTDSQGPFVAGEKLVAWTAVAGVGDGFIEHVWYRDGQEVARHYLPVGHGRRWRTWSRHQLAAGMYTIDVLGPDGRVLAKQSFFVESGEAVCDR